MLKHHSIQLELNFDGTERNRFLDHIRDGKFQILCEIHPPSADTKLEHAVSRYADFQYLTESGGDGLFPPAGLAMINEADENNVLDPVLFLSSLCKNNPDSHLLYLSGRGRTPEQIYAEAEHARNEGIKNFCAVSGITPCGAGSETVSRISFLESVNILEELNRKKPKYFFTGATINPYKYTAEDSSLQYFKAVKKIHCGASFLVTQFGWDMMKLQELRWQTWRRNLNIPLFARLLFPTPEKINDICMGKYPGIQISPDMESLFRKEMQYSSHQFTAAQLRRLQLHVAGAKLLGYHGVQIAGVDSPELFQTILKCIGEAFIEFQDFDNWHNAYCNYYNRMELAPYPYRFYLFNGLLTQAPPPEEFQLNDSEPPVCSQKEMLRYTLAQKLFAHASELPPEERKITKKLILGCKNCVRCRLDETLFVCPELCPKGMANGPCGCSHADGSCEFPIGECVFMQRLRIANTNMDFSMLENTCVPHVPRS